MPTHARGRALAPALAVLALLGAGCGGDNPPAGGESTTTEAPTTSTTQPPASDESSRVVVEGMVVEATALFDVLAQDPALIDDPSDDTFEQLRDIYVDGEVIDQLEQGVRVAVDSGERYRPTESGVFREVAIYTWKPVTDPDVLEFDTCSLIDRERVDAEGNVLAEESQVVFANGEARRVDGVWRFVGLESDMSRGFEIEPGSAEPGFCQNLEPGDPVTGPGA